MNFKQTVLDCVQLKLEADGQAMIDASEERPAKAAKQEHLANPSLAANPESLDPESLVAETERIHGFSTLLPPVTATLAAAKHEHAEDVEVKTEPRDAENAPQRTQTSRYAQKEAAARARAARLVAEKAQRAAAMEARHEVKSSDKCWRAWCMVGHSR